nr:hypothetical protein [Thiorhodococcus minor]
MDPPEATQQLQRPVGQRHEPILVALPRADMQASARRIDIGYRQAQPLTEAKPQAVEGEEEDPVAQRVRPLDQTLGLLDRDDIRQALPFGRLDEVDICPTACT